MARLADGTGSPVPSVMTSLTQGDPVAIADDSEDDARRTALILRDAELTPVILDLAQFNTVEKLVEAARSRAVGLVCDHRLSHGLAMAFTGAEVVAASNAQSLPAILVTGYADIDTQTTIRVWRTGIPQLLRKSFGAEDVTAAFQDVIKEQVNGPPPHRKPYRTVVRITGTDKVGSDFVLETIVTAWDPSDVVIVPVSLVRKTTSLELKTAVGRRLMANVNIHARNADELFFDGFEPAPVIHGEWLEGLRDAL